MGKRPARCYTKVGGPAYTRTQGRRNKGYIRGIPGSKVVMFDMGANDKTFEIAVDMLAKESCHIRHMALEAGRQAINRKLQKLVGRDEYHLTLRTHPHHVLRENKMMAFAGADRMQDGMRRSFGKPTDRASRIKAGDAIFTARVQAKNYEHAVAALKSARAKMPTPVYFEISKGKDLLGLND